MNKLQKLREYLGRVGGEAAWRDVLRLAQGYGYVLDHVQGSHHIVKKPGKPAFSFPVHRKRIKAVYVRKFLKEIQADEKQN